MAAKKPKPETPELVLKENEEIDKALDNAETAVDEAAKSQTLKEIEDMKARAMAEIEEMKAKAAQEIKNAKKPKTTTKTPAVPVDPVKAARAEAMKRVAIEVPRDRSTKIPYTTTILVKGLPTYHAVIPRGKRVMVPMYVAQAIAEDIRQQDNVEILIDQLTEKFETKFDAVMNTK